MAFGVRMDGANVVFICSGVEDSERTPAVRVGYRGGRYISAEASARGEWQPGGSSHAGYDAYATSKQCNLATVLAFARETPRLRFNAVEPGFNPGTDLAREAPAAVRFVLNYGLAPLAPHSKYWSTPKRAAQVITGVLADDWNRTGMYYDENGEPMAASAQSHAPRSKAHSFETEEPDMGPVGGQYLSGLHNCFTADSVVGMSWFTGPGAEFVARSREMSAGGWGGLSVHRLSPPAVRVRGDRALAELPIVIEFRIKIDSIEADLLSWARSQYSAQRADGAWRIARITSIYERDTLTPSVPGTQLNIDSAEFTALRPSYRCLAWREPPRPAATLRLARRRPARTRPASVRSRGRLASRLGLTPSANHLKGTQCLSSHSSPERHPVSAGPTPRSSHPVALT